MSDVKVLNEDLSKEDVTEIKALIRIQLVKLFYTLYVKRTIWGGK